MGNYFHAVPVSIVFIAAILGFIFLHYLAGVGLRTLYVSRSDESKATKKAQDKAWKYLLISAAGIPFLSTVVGLTAMYKIGDNQHAFAGFAEIFLSYAAVYVIAYFAYYVIMILFGIFQPIRRWQEYRSRRALEAQK